jgi:hypothetical protein
MLQAKGPSNLASRETFRLEDGDEVKLNRSRKDVGNGLGDCGNGQIRRMAHIHLRGAVEEMTRIRWRQKLTVPGSGTQHDHREDQDEYGQAEDCRFGLYSHKNGSGHKQTGGGCGRQTEPGLQ